jgi:hypothetical protein
MSTLTLTLSLKEGEGNAERNGQWLMGIGGAH